MGFCLSYFLHSDVSYCVVPIFDEVGVTFPAVCNGFYLL